MTDGLSAELVVSRDPGFRLSLDLQIEAGKTVALLGPNGAGKSTAVGAIAGLVPIDSGVVSLAGRVLDGPREGIFVPPEARRIGVVFQDYILFPHLSVLDNVAFGLAASGMRKPEARRAAAEVLDDLDLAEFTNRHPGDLSGGQAQRVALARALATSPDLLLLDEPLAALDVSTRSGLRHVLADHLGSFAGPRLLITHDPTEAFLLADEICVIEEGVVTQVGSPDEIRLRPRTAYAADLAGSNLLEGVAAAGVVSVGDHRLTIADTTATGPVLATVHPRAISLHRQKPEGSPRNAWQTKITRIEHYGDRVRIQVGAPVPLTAEVTPRAVDVLRLDVADVVWMSIKATEVTVVSG
ncbi:MAG: ABC transporter ATP-binding protein [bacterium]|nr:ABC transporter ATP-binding protein [bacterium]